MAFVDNKQSDGGEFYARPEYIVKLFYLDKYNECVDARRIYKVSKRLGKNNPSFKIDWEEKVKALCSYLYSKILRENRVNSSYMKESYRIAENPDAQCTDAQLTEAMNEVNAFFEKRKYTMVEETYGDLGSVIVDER
jgi:hypothetical protein